MRPSKSFSALNKNELKKNLDKLYLEYNQKKYIEYDPIKYVYRFKDKTEQELVALVSSSLSFGRVKQIFKAMDNFLLICKNKPLDYVLNLPPKASEELETFQYRFVNGPDLFNLLNKAKILINRHVSIGNFIKKNYDKGQFLKLPEKFIQNFQNVNYLIPSKFKTSACKRLFMYFRWMVRKDNIDLGLWDFIDPGELIIPLDTHIFQTSKHYGLTNKNSASLTTAIEITNKLKEFSSDDPVKYDWALSHIGIIKNNFI